MPSRPAGAACGPGPVGRTGIAHPPTQETEESGPSGTFGGFRATAAPTILLVSAPKGSPVVNLRSRPLEARPGARRFAGGLGSRWSLVSELLARLEFFFVPVATLADGSLDDREIQARYRHVVGLIAGVAVAFFVPSLPIAGVPTHLWPLFVAGTVVAACLIMGALLVARADTRWALVAAFVNALVIAGLDWLVGDYYHQTVLLFPLVVAGHAIIHGFRAALVMAACGSLVVPLATPVEGGLNPTDPVYAFMWLLGIAAIPWIYRRLEDRASSALRASEAKYRELVERVPAIVYTADFGPEGAWRYVSPRAEEVLGFHAEAWTSDPTFWWSRVHPDDRDRVLAEETESWRNPPGRVTSVEYRMIDRDGQVRWVSDDAAVVASDDGSPSHWSGFLIDITERKALEEQLQHQAFHDPLTGLANRALFADRVEHALARSQRRRDVPAVLFLDLDDFKTVNDGMGHEAGDALLVAVGHALRACLRPMDTAARLGGDEFAVLVENVPDDEAAIDIAERIQTTLMQPFSIHGREIVTGASIGIARPRAGRVSAATLLRNADSAMYAAKRCGKGRYELYAPAMHAAAVQRLELAGEIRRALELGEFAVHYQPEVRLRDGSISGFEALVRWNHPRRGLVLPAEFIPAAEETGQIIAIGGIVLDEACRQARAWQDDYAEDPARTMSVNVSPRQFRDPFLCRSVAAAVAASGLDPSSLVLEITENVLMEDSEGALQRLGELKALGVRLAIDDFGTGYSSLSYLRRLPVDILKIDKSFVDAIADEGEGSALARVIIRMGQTLHLVTVAEGVELPSQAAALRRMGCGLAQGFHFARPMVADEVAVLLARAADRGRRVS